MKNILFLLPFTLIPTLALANTDTPVDKGPADAAVHAAIDEGKILNCDGDHGSCHNHDYDYNLYYNPDKTVAVAWVLGYPFTGGSMAGGGLAEFRDLNGWKLVQLYKTRHSINGRAPKTNEVTFLSPSNFKITYHYLRDQDPQCCATGRITEIFPLR